MITPSNFTLHFVGTVNLSGDIMRKTLETKPYQAAKSTDTPEGYLSGVCNLPHK